MRYQAALRPECSTNTADKTKFKGYISYKFLINLEFNAITVYMIIECPNCYKKFNLDEKLIPEAGRALKCSNCNNIWHFKILQVDKDYNKQSSDKKNSENIDDFLNNDKNRINNKKKSFKNDISETKDKKNRNKEGVSIKMFFILFAIIIISILSLILLLDTFKVYLIELFPRINPIFDSFYETFLDLKLFIKDLTN